MTKMLHAKISAIIAPELHNLSCIISPTFMLEGSFGTKLPNSSCTSAPAAFELTALMNGATRYHTI